MIRVRLAVVMAYQKLNIQDVADLTGLSRSTISALVNESGQGVKFETLDILCGKLNCTPGDLLEFTGDNE